MMIFVLGTVTVFILLVINEIKRLAESIQENQERKRKGQGM